ncbi:MAG: hypothetical protein WCW84_02270 [Sulfurimonas sp.]|jgi:hypothetical protein
MENNKNKPRRIAPNYGQMTEKEMNSFLDNEHNAREKVRAKLASGEPIIIPKEINDAFLEAEKAS